MDSPQPRRLVLVQPNDQPLVARRLISNRSVDRVVLRHAGSRDDLNPTAKTIPVRPLPGGLDPKPGAAIAAVIPQEIGLLIHVGDDDVNVAVVVDIAERGASARPF